VESGPVAETNDPNPATQTSPPPQVAFEAIEHPDSPPPGKSKKKPAVQDDQLSLFNWGALSESDEEAQELSADNASESSQVSSSPPTTVVAYVILDPKHKNLYIRGLTNKNGEDSTAKMEFIDVGKYQLEIEDLQQESTIEFWANNKKRSKSPPLSIQPGETYEVYPEF